MNPRRPHPYQLTDSEFTVRAECGSWAVLECYRWLIAPGEKDDMERPVAWFHSREEAEAERDRRARR